VLLFDRKNIFSSLNNTYLIHIVDCSAWNKAKFGAKLCSFFVKTKFFLEKVNFVDKA
jgi:hypothetical protein